MTLMRNGESVVEFAMLLTKNNVKLAENRTEQVF